MNTRQVIVALYPGRIDLVVYQGPRRVGSKRLPITEEPEAGEWANMVRRSAASLRSIVEEMRLTGCGATVLYHSPTQAVDLVSFAVRWGSEAIEAAKLSCTEALSYSAMSAVCEGAAVGRDAGGEARQTHVVVAAEREDIAQAVVQLIEQSGLKLISVTPLDAAITACVAKVALDDGGPGQGWLYIGEYTSFFVIARGGTLLYCRRINLGLGSLANSLTRPIHVPGGNQSIELDIEAARFLLHLHGIPQRDQDVHELLGLTGGQVIPLLQPVLQRYVVELRQSLRFGLREEDRQIAADPHMTIRLTGPGSAIPGFAELFTQELGIETMCDSAYGGYDWSEPGSEGSELSDVVKDTRLLKRLNLLPHELARRRRSGRLRRWLWTGAAAAVAVIALDGLRYHTRLAHAQRRSDTYASQIDDLRALEATGRRLRAVLGAMDQLEQTIDKNVGRRVDYRAAMHELGRLTPTTIRFTSLSLHRLPENTLGTVTGYALPRGSDTSRTDLEAYIERLRASPLFDDVALGQVQIASSRKIKGQRFEATFTAVAIPVNQGQTDQVASSEGGSRP